MQFLRIAISVLSGAVFLCDAAGASMPTVSYTALSDAVRKSGQLARYESVPVTKRTIMIGDHSLDVSVPRTARAYDIIPIQYTLRQPEGERVTAVEAVAYENRKKAGTRAFYDLAIPGNINVKIDYLGSVCADWDKSKHHPMTVDGKSPISKSLPFKRDALVTSSTIRPAELTWFKFKITNTGDTILDPEGFSALFIEPQITKFGADGKAEWTRGTENLFERPLTYMYPGDSEVFWVVFYIPDFPNQRGFIEGDYTIELGLLYRAYKDFNWGMNIWRGEKFASFTMPIQVRKGGGVTPVRSTYEILDKGDKTPGIFDTFEEFMTSFRIFQGEQKPEQSGTIYLQVAPWTTHVTAKLILTNPNEIAVVRVPIKITDENLQIRYNPKNMMVVGDGEREMPAVVYMEMTYMRVGIQQGPYPEIDMEHRLKELKSCGVNVISDCCQNPYMPELSDPDYLQPGAECWKYFNDILMRKHGMKSMGWSVYPSTGKWQYDYAEPLFGQKLKYSTTWDGVDPANTTAQVDRGDPMLPEMVAAWVRYAYGRWGDFWFTTKDGRMPIEIEDSWGWMRDDINCRYVDGPLAMQKFRDWTKAKYGSIDAVNAAWGSKFTSFGEINPEDDYGTEDGMKMVFDRMDRVFHDWSPAMADWDTFRTELRLDTIQKITELVRKTIPNADMSLRTEGANLPIRVDPNSPSMHMRHVYYSQQRQALVYDAVKRANVITFYGDYTTLPYTEAEWRQSMRQMVADGITPVFLPQFDHMRDILINPYYGREYQMHYGLDKPAKGMMIHCLMAAYPWWKATYEEGGAPGIIGSDYLCDGFTTETQKRELKYLNRTFKKMRDFDEVGD